MQETRVILFLVGLSAGWTPGADTPRAQPDRSVAQIRLAAEEPRAEAGRTGWSDPVRRARVGSGNFNGNGNVGNFNGNGHSGSFNGNGHRSSGKGNGFGRDGTGNGPDTP